VIIFRATVQSRNRSVAPAAAANVLENCISTAHMPARAASESADTPTYRTETLASTPPEIALALPAAPAPRPPRPAGQRQGLRLGDLGALRVPISHRSDPWPPEQGRRALHRARGGGAHRAGPCAAARAGAGAGAPALQNGRWIDRPFIVLTETKFSKRHIPVWARYSPLRTRVEAHANTLSP
jgi:hypothetical protein